MHAYRSLYKKTTIQLDLYDSCSAQCDRMIDLLARLYKLVNGTNLKFFYSVDLCLE